MSATNIEWDEGYSLGISNIDIQHKNLFEIAGKVFSLKESPNVKEEIRIILYELNDYIKKHFAEEEAFMEEISFPDSDYHKKLHRKIVENVTSITKNNHRLDTIQTKMRIIAKRALIEHIMNEDMKIKLFLETLPKNNLNIQLDSIIALD